MTTLNQHLKSYNLSIPVVVYGSDRQQVTCPSRSSFLSGHFRWTLTIKTACYRIYINIYIQHVQHSHMQYRATTASTTATTASTTTPTTATTSHIELKICVICCELNNSFPSFPAAVMEEVFKYSLLKLKYQYSNLKILHCNKSVASYLRKRLLSFKP